MRYRSLCYCSSKRPRWYVHSCSQTSVRCIHSYLQIYVVIVGSAAVGIRMLILWMAPFVVENADWVDTILDGWLSMLSIWVTTMAAIVTGAVCTATTKV